MFDRALLFTVGRIDRTNKAGSSRRFGVFGKVLEVDKQTAVV